MSLRLCSSHSHDLQKALERKGLWHLANPARARESAEAWLKGETTKDGFDPYVAASLEINGKVTKLGFAQRLNGGVRCPLCHVSHSLRDARAPAAWIDNVTDLLVIVARTNNIELRSPT